MNGGALLLVVVGLMGCGQKDGSSSAEDPEEDLSPRAVAAPLEESGKPEATSEGRGEVSSVDGTIDRGPRSSLLSIRETSNGRYLADVARDVAHLDPRQEGWITELISEAAGKRLAALKAFIEGETVPSLDDLASGLGDGFRCTPLRPSELEVRFEEEGIQVLRADGDDLSPSDWRDGAEGLSRSLLELLGPGWDQGTEEEADHRSVKSHWKVVGVTINGGTATTRLLLEVDGNGPQGRIQQNATWEMDWLATPSEGGLPLLNEIRVSSFEESRVPARQNAAFSDQTWGVLGQNASFREQLAVGLDYWRDRLDWRFTQEVTGPHGLALGDVNGDGREDLFVCDAGGLPNRLYVQEPDGSLRDHSRQAGVDYLEPAAAALLIDLDNDSDQDLVFGSGRNLVVLENGGTGVFKRQSVIRSDAVARSLTAVDYNLDGRLDLYVCGYFSQMGDGSGIGRPMPYHDANNGVRNSLLENQGGWHFSDVTVSVGLDENNRRFSYAAAWEDYDNDGDLDLYVANDFGRNNLYRNDHGQFVDVAAMAGVEDISAGMSVSWGDYNRDGWPDLYIGNMFSSAGNRIAYQRRYRSHEAGEARGLYQRHARGNTLFLNEGDGTFKDVSLEAGVTMGRWAWGSLFADLNNDGWEDLVIANGLVTSPDDTGDL